MENLRSKTLSGFAWSGLAHGGKQFFQFIVSVILARLLTPHDFGLIGMIVVFTGFAELFSDLGLGSALIQKDSIEERHLNAVFWVTVLLGVMLACACAASSILLSKFYKESLLRQLTLVFAFNFFFNSLNIVHTALLQKRMDFRRLAATEIIAAFISGTISIVMALSGFGVWCLAAQPLLFTILSSVMLWWFSTWRPHFCFDGRSLKDLLRFGMHLLGFNVFNYWVRNTDNLLIGKYIGSSGLGIYGRAYSLMMLPVSQISNVIGRVMFPALCAIHDDRALTRQVYLNATRIIGLISFPLMTWLLILAEPFVLLLYGEKWHGIIPVFQILCITGIGQTVGVTVGWIYTSQGRTDIMLRWGIFSGLIYIVSFIIGIHWGVIGVAAAYAISGYLIIWYPAWMIPGRLINISFSEMLKNLSGPFYCTIGMGSAMVMLNYLLPPGWPNWLVLAVQIPFGLSVYYMLIKRFRIRAYEEIRLLLREHIVSLQSGPA